jgi:hypothetical protein
MPRLFGGKSMVPPPKEKQTKSMLGVLMIVKDDREGGINLDPSFSERGDPHS